jgi:myo-inositol-1(or 4)-monophosphatase
MLKDINRIYSEAKVLCIEVGTYIAHEREIFQLEDIEYKDLNNLVSYVDKEAEKKLVKGLKKLLPEAGFLTEEGTTEDTTKETDYLWIIDPLDGTANFIHNMPHYSVSVALYHKNQAILGFVYDVCRKQMYHAMSGAGAYCDQKRLQVSPNKHLGACLIATGFPYYKFEQMKDYLRILEELMQKTHGLRRAGSAALDLAYVAAGYFDAFYEYNLNAWDMAAGILLVKEAGGELVDFSGKDGYLYGGDIIASGSCGQELLKLIQEFWNKN